MVCLYPEYTAESVDRLTAEHYRFYVHDDLTFELDAFSKLSRPSTRHRFRVIAKWHRLDTRDNTLPKPEAISQCVIDAVKRQLVDKLKYVQGADRGSI